MAVRGSAAARRNMDRLVAQIQGRLSERAVMEALIIGGGMAATMTPVDTSNLINSQFRIIERVATGVRGRMGYTAAYAAAVHDASGKLKGDPRDPNDPSRGNFWDPAGEPDFLTKGFEQTKADIDAAVKRNLSL